MMLWAEMVLLDRAATDHRELLEDLKPFVSDAPSLTSIIDERLKPQKGSAELRRMEAANAKHTEQAERCAGKGPCKLGDVLAGDRARPGRGFCHRPRPEHGLESMAGG